MAIAVLIKEVNTQDGHTPVPKRTNHFYRTTDIILYQVHRTAKKTFVHMMNGPEH